MSSEDLKKEALTGDVSCDPDCNKSTTDSVKIEMPATKEIDIHHRDPLSINGHIQVRFHDIIAEPDPEVFSFDKVWELSFTSFTNTKIWCYRILSAVFAIPLSVLWGLYFACVAFCSVWCCMPCIKSEQIEIECVRKVWQALIDAFVAPCCAGIGRVFGDMRLKKTQE